jgi:RNA polymerase sigma-70 factor (ECF subfamily)
VAQWRDFQRFMTKAIYRPLKAPSPTRKRWPDDRKTEEGAIAFVKPNDLLTSFERLEIYNRQDRFRVLDCFYDHYPTCTDAERLQKGYRYALALTHHPADAEDLVHEAWLNISRRYGRVESNALLVTAVRNLFIDQCRRKKIVKFESLDQPEPPELLSLTETEPGLEGDLVALLAILRPGEREAIFLHYYEGRTAEEIGQLTGQPRGTVLSLLHRSIAKLRTAVVQADGKTHYNQWLA